VSAIPSYFDDFRAAKDFRKEALSWIGTPFREYYQEELEAGRAQLGDRAASLDVKGPGGGIDCVGLVQEIFARSGATDKWVFPRTSATISRIRPAKRFSIGCAAKLTIHAVNDSVRSCVELEIPDGVTDPKADTPRDFFKPGDILVMRHGALFHMPVIIDNDLHFVNAIPRMGVIEGTIQDSSYSSHLVAVFRLKPMETARPRAA
jgi:cell wall-associated NlpC family hydrolase